MIKDFIFFIYRFLTKKAFYITGTFIDNDGIRRFCKMTFMTYGNILPIKELERGMKESLGAKNDVIILHINRIPYGMVKYVTDDSSQMINIERRD